MRYAERVITLIFFVCFANCAVSSLACFLPFLVVGHTHQPCVRLYRENSHTINIKFKHI